MGAKFRRILLNIARQWRVPISVEQRKYVRSRPDESYEAIAEWFVDGTLSTENEICNGLQILWSIPSDSACRFVSLVELQMESPFESVRSRCYYFLARIEKYRHHSFNELQPLVGHLRRLEALGVSEWCLAFGKEELPELG